MATTYLRVASWVTSHRVLRAKLCYLHRESSVGDSLWMINLDGATGWWSTRLQLYFHGSSGAGHATACMDGTLDLLYACLNHYLTSHDCGRNSNEIPDDWISRWYQGASRGLCQTPEVGVAVLVRWLLKSGRCMYDDLPVAHLATCRHHTGTLKIRLAYRGKVQDVHAVC
jgi:hypothetical protein